MKTKIYTLAAIITLQMSTLFGANNMFSTVPVKDMNNTMSVILVPTTPSEADFSDIVPEPPAKIYNLAPAAPRFADFEDTNPETTSGTVSLNPETPATADFSEDIEAGVVTLAPVSPEVADFEE